MIFRVKMKDPDVLTDCIKEAVDKLSIDGLDKEEIECIKEHRIEKTIDLCTKWFKYGEYINLEIDTEKETCVVIPEK